MPTSSLSSFPLLDAQLGVVLACESAPHSTAWNLPSVICFDKAFPVGRLVTALQRITRERAELHIQFEHTDTGEIRQVADPDVFVGVTQRKMSEEEAERYINGEFVRPFALFTRQPLCRFEVIETEARTLLLTDFHHSIADGYTIAGRLMGHDLPAAFSGLLLHQSGMSLLQWAEHEREQWDSADYLKAKSYFLQWCGGCEATRLHHEAKVSSVGRKCLADGFRIDAAWIDGWCATHRAAPYHLLMAAFSLALSKLSHQTKVLFSTVNHGRYDKKVREAYGMFVSTVPFLVEIGPDMGTADLLSQIRHRLMDCQRHRVYPFTHFCRDAGIIPKITFGFQGGGILEQTILEGKKYEGKQLPHQYAQTDLSVMVYLSSTDYEVRMEAADGLYVAADLHRLGGAMCRCLEGLMRDDTPVGGIELTDSQERERLLRLSTGQQTADETATAVSLFLRQAMATPDALAVGGEACPLTYRELELRSRSLAHHLIESGVANDPFVGVDTTPCGEFLVAVMAIMRAGAAYVPIDPQLPEKRRRHILDNAGIHHVIDADAVRAHAQDKDATPLIDHSDPQRPAYMIYTSGTTGMPKGVVVAHAALANLIRFCVRRWPLSAKSRIACHSTLAFDASVEDLFPVLTVGGSVWMVPEHMRMDLDALAQFIGRHHITGGCYTTRLGVALAQAHRLHLDYFCLGGERLSTVPQVDGRVYNTYGPTEFTVDATYFELEPDRAYSSIPIGRPVDNCSAFVVDPYGCLLPQGATGELWLGGRQIADGYWGDPVLTARKFTPCGFYPQKVYHTGDLARWNEDGMLEFVGRMDNEVKINGIRVSLEEIERCLLAIPGVTNAAVVTEGESDPMVIHAFFTAGSDIQGGEIMAHLRQSLPVQMLPKRITQLEEMPLTSSGKTDRRQLCAAHVVAHATAGVEPANEDERRICRLMSGVLHLEVGVNDDFFMMGGTSISAMQLVAEARKERLTMAYGDVFSHPTPRQLAKAIGGDGDNAHGNIGRYDYQPIDHLLQADDPAVSTETLTGGTVLLTGCTGYLGIHLLHRFLADPAWRVIGMVRAAHEQAAWEKLLSRWTYYFDAEPLDHDRVQIVVADLMQPQSLQPLTDLPFTLLINAAADTRYFANDGQLVGVNADGAGRLADICLKKGVRMVHISTMSVGGVDLSGRPLAISAQTLYQGQRFFDEYSYSKFLAERTVLAKVASDGLRAAVLRMGHLTARSTDGKTQANVGENMLNAVLEVMVRLGGCPMMAGQVMVDWAPVDLAASQVVHCAVEPISHPILHIDSQKPCSMKTLADRMAHASLPQWSNEEFHRRLHALDASEAGVVMLREMLARL